MVFNPLNHIKPLAGKVLETALNRALALDAETQHALLALEGQKIALSIQTPPIAFEIHVVQGKLQVHPLREEKGEEHAPDLSIKTTLGGLLGQIPLFANPNKPAPMGRLKVSGDAELARRLQQLAQQFDPDWQQPFVAVFGEIIGVQVALAVRSALTQAQSTAHYVVTSAAEYVTEESRDVLSRNELEAFYDDVDALRDDVERLAARIQRFTLKTTGQRA